MAANLLKGLGQGLYAAGGTIGQGMMADIQQRRQMELEAMREASAERRWNREADLRRSEREAERKDRAAERKEYREFQSSENEKQRQQQQRSIDAQNARLDKQLNLTERRAIVDDLYAVDQAGMRQIADIQSKFVDRKAKLDERMLPPAEYAKELATLQKQLVDMVEQTNVQVSARKEQIANAYGDLGRQYLESVDFSKLPTDLTGAGDTAGGAGTADTGAARDTAKPGAAVPVVEPSSGGLGFGSAFDLSRRVARGELSQTEANKALDELVLSPSTSRAGAGLAVPGAITGAVVGAGQGLYDWAFKPVQR